MTLDLLCLGEPLVEFNQQPDGRYVSGHGGDTSNCAVAAARQGTKVGYITHIGADSFGESLLELWNSEGIDTSGVARCKDAPTGIYFVHHNESGHQFSYFRKGSAASRMKPDDLPVELLSRCRYLHISAISQAISSSATDSVFRAIEVVRSAGGQISYDTNLRLNLWPLDRARAIIHATAALADILLPGLDDASLLCNETDPDRIIDFYLALGARRIVLTMGQEGVFIAEPGTRQRLAAKQVRAVDATGAGDSFDGAFLARLAAGDSMIKAAQYANAAAALSTTGFGAVAPIPRAEEVRAFLASDPFSDQPHVQDTDAERLPS